MVIQYVSRTLWWLTHREWGSRLGTTAASKRMRCWNSPSWRATRTSQANPPPNHDGRKTKPKATPDLSASEWRRTSWSMGQSHMTLLTTGFITKILIYLSTDTSVLQFMLRIPINMQRCKKGSIVLRITQMGLNLYTAFINMWGAVINK